MLLYTYGCGRRIPDIVNDDEVDGVDGGDVDRAVAIEDSTDGEDRWSVPAGHTVQ